MKALQFDRVGSLDALRITELPIPEPHAGEVLVEVRAAGLNPSDVKNVLGRFPYTTLPRVPGRDFAGVVVKGPSALRGRDVWGTGGDLGFAHDGSHAEFLTVSATGVALKPKSLSFMQAASCGVPYTTALNALDRAAVQAGTKFLIIGAAGAVGSAAMALAQALGAQVVGAVRRSTQARELTQAGIPALELTEGVSLQELLKPHFAEGAEVIFDTTGLWLAEAVAALASFGRIAIIAAPADGLVNVPVLDLYRRGGSIVGINSLLYDATACATMLTRIAADFDQGRLPPPKAPLSVPLTNGLAAYDEVNRGSAAAKIVLSPRSD